MTDLKIKEFFSSAPVFEKLTRLNNPIVLYGTGNGASKLLSICEDMGIKISGVFVSDDFWRGQEFCGFRVKKYADIAEEFIDPVVLVAFGTDRQEVISNIIKIAGQRELYVPEMPLFGGGLFDLDYLNAHMEEILYAFSLMGDDISRKIFLNVINFKISGELKYIEPHLKEDEDTDGFLKYSPGEVFVDLGAYRGDTVLEFIKNAPLYEKIFAFEPDNKNCEKLRAACKDIRDIYIYNAAAYNENCEIGFFMGGGRQSAIGGEVKINALSVDNCLEKRRASVIKFDVEGAEKEALLGCANTIKQYMPKLIVSVYHRNGDIFSLPILINSIAPGYRFFIRRKRAIPAWDTFLYAVK